MKKIIVTASIMTLVLVLVGSAFALGVLVGPFNSKEQMAPVQNNPVFYNTLGYKLSQEGKNIEAQAAFAHAIELKPDYTNARSNLATIAFANKDYNVAIVNLRWLVANYPDNQNYKFDLAQNLVSQARYVDYDVVKLQEGESIYSSLGDFPHASENAVIVDHVLSDIADATVGN